MFALLASALLFFIPVFPGIAAMDYAKQVLIESDFSNRDLRGVTFNLTNLLKANLSGSDLEGASLFGAKLQEADLSNTNLRDATLDSAIFEGTDLTNAILEDAFAFNTRFSDVIITGADFTNVPMRDDVLNGLCLAAEGTNPVTGRNTRETLGCN
ncbi:pentapeptide repeat-containing protein [Prochlorococcus sp. MIT 1307]|uniref:pentapeptide repeat-containing protein n=1 Tax=Prochlorococcus sp. MIT 1307 TaxID=3096219 RepID=UPI002A74D13D|nr:pentapeptide repeat-containing protein [Prochlorococcus sp. MIT 1307]